MDSAGIVLKLKKIRVYPTADQRAIFRKWFGAARFVYNATIESLKPKGTKAAWKSIKGGLLQNSPGWTASVPYQIKSVSVRDACRAVSAAKKKYAATKQFQHMRFRYRKNPIQSCYIPKSAISKTGIYHTMSGELKWTEDLPEKHGDARLVCENGRWFVCLPTESQQEKPENQGRVVSLDPGVRTFLTFFSENHCGKLGQGDFGRIQRLCAHLDSLRSKISKAEHGQKQRMRRAAQRIQWKIKDLVLELHHKSARFLVDNFDVILLPTFETQDMVRRSARKITSRTARAMLTWAHFKFKIFLKHKAFECAKVVVDCNEAFTSKTISWTGEIIENLGGRRSVKSKLDGQEMDRDYNGARGIFLRALVEPPSLKNESP